MTAEITTTEPAPLTEYGVQSFSKEHAHHVVTPCDNHAAALARLGDERRHVDAWAALMSRTGPDGLWRAVSPDEGIEAWAPSTGREAVTHG